jgi:DNA polymerase-3 subunit gamma/tau
MDDERMMPGLVPPRETAAYRVLARKYRPKTFSEMIGQEALVRTLTNAIAAGRLAHAFILTGVRGVGKTTSARIIARALNCIGPDGAGGPTAEPCGICEPCRSILAERAVDVLEMDAASRTGVDDMREVIDGVRYGPVACRYKIYIVDEVHMLSKSAFNALLKTLEEPPPHVKFVFATTEIRKVPVTVLSRCQRFDLRRVDAALLTRHFASIVAQEGAAAEPEALAMIARAADGSVRDGLSLLDQAIAQGAGEATPHVTAAAVRAMLGLADRSIVLGLVEAAAAGDGPRLLDVLDEARREGADPQALIGDLLHFVHLLTRAKLVPGVFDDPALPEIERDRGTALVEGLSMAALARAWQTLLKGVGEVQSAPSPQTALEMVLIRLMHMADLPTPADLVRRLANAGDASQGATAVSTRTQTGSGPQGAAGAALALASPPDRWPNPASEPAIEPRCEPAAVPMAEPRSFAELVDLAFARDAVLHGQLQVGAHLVRFAPRRLEFRPAAGAPADLAQRLSSALKAWTGERWMVIVSAEPGEPTLADQARASYRDAVGRAAQHPVVRAALEIFPGAVIRDIRNPLGPLRDEPDAATPRTAEEEITDP